MVARVTPRGLETELVGDWLHPRERDVSTTTGLVASHTAHTKLTPRVSQAAARVFTMLPSTPQVEAVYLGESGLMAGLANVTGESLTDAIVASPWLLGDGTGDKPAATKAHSLFVDHTTLDPNAAKRIADTVHEQSKDVYMVDGPVSGGGYQVLHPALWASYTDRLKWKLTARYRRSPGWLADDHVRLREPDRLGTRCAAHAVHGAARRRGPVRRQRCRCRCQGLQQVSESPPFGNTTQVGKEIAESRQFSVV